MERCRSSFLSRKIKHRKNLPSPLALLLFQVHDAFAKRNFPLRKECRPLPKEPSLIGISKQAWRDVTFPPDLTPSLCMLAMIAGNSPCMHEVA
jgi:hypothetical protein